MPVCTSVMYSFISISLRCRKLFKLAKYQENKEDTEDSLQTHAKILKHRQFKFTLTLPLENHRAK
jgi:hypothetical protein